MTYRILSLDGGGIKGLLTAQILTRLHTEYPTLLNNTDLFAGTSTGGLLALGMAAGFEPSEIVNLYKTRARAIFKDSLLDDIRDVGRSIGAQYKNTSFKKELEALFGADTTLGDLPQHVLIPTFDLDAPATVFHPRMWKPKFFHNFKGRDSDGRELVVDVALRTSAAPTYFPSYQGYIDGGVVANNPSMAAVAAALDDRCASCSLKDLRLLSISSGLEPMYLKGQRLNWGLLQWVKPITTLMVSGIEGVADFQVKQLLKQNYRRVDPVLTRKVSMDDVRDKTLKYLMQEANNAPLDSVVNWLEQRRW